VLHGRKVLWHSAFLKLNGGLFCFPTSEFSSPFPLPTKQLDPTVSRSRKAVVCLILLLAITRWHLPCPASLQLPRRGLDLFRAQLLSQSNDRSSKTRQSRAFSLPTEFPHQVSDLSLFSQQKVFIDDEPLQDASNWSQRYIQEIISINLHFFSLIFHCPSFNLLTVAQFARASLAKMPRAPPPITSWRRKPRSASEASREIRLARLPRSFRNRCPGFLMADRPSLLLLPSTLRVRPGLLLHPNTLRARTMVRLLGEHPTTCPVYRASSITQLPIRMDTDPAMAMIPLDSPVELGCNIRTWNARSRPAAWTCRWD